MGTLGFYFIDNVVEFNLRASLRLIAGGSVVNVGTVRRQTLLDVIAALAKIYGCKSDFRISGQFRIDDTRLFAANKKSLRRVLGDHEFTEL